MSSITIRAAEEKDVPLIWEFIHGLAVYEKRPEQMTATQEDLARTLFGPRPWAEVFLAEYEGQPAAFALYFFTYSTFLGKPGIHLEDLYCHPQFRGKGIGKALIRRVAQRTLELEGGRLEWQCLRWNQPSIEFYQSLDARDLDDWMDYRLEGEALERLAVSSGEEKEPVS